MESLRPNELEQVRAQINEWRLDLQASEGFLESTFQVGDLFEYHRDRIAYLRPLIEQMSTIVEAHENGGMNGGT